MPLLFAAPVFAQDANQSASASTNAAGPVDLDELIKLDPVLLRALKDRFDATTFTNEPAVKGFGAPLVDERKSFPREFFYSEFNPAVGIDSKPKIYKKTKDTPISGVKALINARTSDDLSSAIIAILLQTNITPREQAYLRALEEMDLSERELFLNLTPQRKLRILSAAFEKSAKAGRLYELTESSKVLEIIKALDNAQDIYQITVTKGDGTQVNFRRAHDAEGHDGYLTEKPETTEDMADFIGPREAE